ncbi:MAG: D-2-hydroxyacid dehydrogenase [Kiloniellales bacterium]
MAYDRAKHPSVLIVADDGALYEERLRQRFPALTLASANSLDEVKARLEALRPEVVFSVKQPSTPLQSHRLAIDYPSVRWFHVGGSGYEHVTPWDGARLAVSNSAGVLARYLAETVTAAILLLNGNFLRYVRQQDDRIWQPLAFRPLAGQTLLVVGVGHIGGHVASNAKALGMQVIGVRRTAEPHPGVDRMLTIEELHGALGEADFVSLHLRLTEQTRHLIDRTALVAMKPGAHLINTARGPIVDEAALIEALQDRRLAGAYLDVFETEPLPADSPLWSLETVMITPHAADTVSTWQALFADFFADNLERWLAGLPLRNLVQPPV